MIKTCQYRNCSQPFEGRSNAKYCSKQCKRNANKILQRETKRVANDKDRAKQLLKDYQNSDISETIRSLYNKIYNNG